MTDLRAALPVDIVLLSLHGAMVAAGYDDCEMDIIDRVRQIVGPSVPIGVELDLHSDLTDQMMEQADAIVLYKEYPHTDIAERAVELFELVVRTKADLIRPAMTAFDGKMIGFYLTSFQPMRGYVDKMIAREGKDGVLSLSLFHTFPWGDVPTLAVKMLAIETPVGDAVALHCRGIDIVANSARRQVFSPMVFTELGINPTQKKLLVVKSAQHFYAGFEPIASEIIYMSAPGAIAPRFTEIPYRRVDTHKFPWVDDPFAES